MYKGKCWQLHVVVGYSCENDFDRLRSCEDDCLIIFYSEKEKLSVFSVSQPNFQFICHFFNQELNWKSQRAISLENLWLVPMLTGRRSEQDWSERQSSNPTFDARDDGPLTHWRTPCVSLTPMTAQIYFTISLFREMFKSDIFSQWWSMVQSIITQFTHLQYKV